MGTLADEMTKVVSEWDKQDEEIKQEESTVKNMSTPVKILKFIEANPEVEQLRIRQHIERNHPEIPLQHIATTLHQLVGSFRLTRRPFVDIDGTESYVYSVISDADRSVMRKKYKERKTLMNEAAARAREGKLKKKAEREAMKQQPTKQKTKQVSISDLFKVNPPAPVKRTPKDILDGLSVIEARELYDELIRIFTGR